MILCSLLAAWNFQGGNYPPLEIPGSKQARYYDIVLKAIKLMSPCPDNNNLCIYNTLLPLSESQFI